MIKQNIVFVFILTIFTVFSYAQNSINQFDASGKRHGYWSKNFEQTDQKRYEGNFIHGKEEGLFKFYRLVRGKSKLSATKLFSSGSDTAEVEFLTSTGKVISKGKMKGKLYIGKWTYYHKNSDAIMTIEHYNDDGELNGEKVIYYLNGTIAEKMTYVKDKIEGKSVWYSEAGILLKECFYKNGELNGYTKFFDAKGRIKAEGVYENDRKTGIWKLYDDGRFSEEKDFTKKIKRYKKKTP